MDRDPQASLTERSCFPGESPLAATDHELTLIVPAYNEQRRLPRTLEEIAAYFQTWKVDHQILVANDGSTDRTSQIVAEFGKKFRAVDLPKQSGKGCAVRTAMMQATGQVVAFTDADLPFGLDSVRQGYEAIAAGEVEVVFGARDLAAAKDVASRSLARRAATFGCRQVVRNLISREISDTQCGLKLFSRRAALEIFSRATINGFAFDTEVVMLTHRLRLPYSRIPVVLINDYGSTVSIRRHAIPMLKQIVGLWNQTRKEAFHIECRHDQSWNRIDVAAQSAQQQSKRAA